MIPTPEEAFHLLCEYNQGEFHQRHGLIVGDVMRWFAIELGYGEEADFWQAVGILYDLDFEKWPEQHCLKEQDILPERDMEVQSIKKKYQDKKFAAGCSREVIERGAGMLSWDLEALLGHTLQAMKASHAVD